MLNAVIHPLPRFKICAVLSAYGAVEWETKPRQEMRFSALAEETGLKAPALSKQLSALEEAGFVTRFREYGSTRAKDTVWVMLTEQGKKAFDAHLAALQSMSEPGQ
ncbi:MarR family transcriptional regulator [Corynebacterium phocae]|uniref:MarR family transcriptional regulator n=1 Tax=Corynebacterium phocae TaxID=161895 RepID=A0A1L7D3P4_9CORY|nr:transcriptional regulator [Corynebacterium phocae]APT92725.1 MarR family transcriptional regulator [Corynebacterium phocae]KAA8723033.1 ArsR family transcriptional regulator [Corynebacterium phocae]